jgi:hypothetical protein
MRSTQSDVNRTFLKVALVLLVAGCAAKKPVELADPRLGDVAVKPLQPASSDHYAEPAPDERYDYPVQFDENAPPAYPDALLAKQLPPVRMKVRLIVDETGIVTESAPLDSSESADPAFFGAIQTAVRDWKFTPLVRITAAPERTDIIFQGVIMTYTGKATALPFHQDYEFTFTQRDGKGFVSTQAPARP